MPADSQWADPDYYAREVERIAQKQAAKKYLPRMTLKSNDPTSEPPKKDIKQRRMRSAEKSRMDARLRQYATIREAIALFERFPQAKRLGDIPGWEEVFRDGAQPAVPSQKAQDLTSEELREWGRQYQLRIAEAEAYRANREPCG